LNLPRSVNLDFPPVVFLRVADFLKLGLAQVGDGVQHIPRKNRQARQGAPDVDPGFRRPLFTGVLVHLPPEPAGDLLRGEIVDFPGAAIAGETIEVFFQGLDMSRRKIASPLVVQEKLDAFLDAFRLEALVPVVNQEEFHRLPQRRSSCLISQELLQFVVGLDVVVDRILGKGVRLVGVQPVEFLGEIVAGRVEALEAVAVWFSREPEVGPVDARLGSELDPSRAPVGFVAERELDGLMRAGFGHGSIYMHCMHFCTAKMGFL